MFEWDTQKAASNFEKHGVTFEATATVFEDPNAQTIPDPDRSQFEERSLTLGFFDRFRVLLVVTTERGEAIRIISARKASNRERANYERIF